jgi:Ca2+-binding EF-hand superfamily protein
MNLLKAMAAAFAVAAMSVSDASAQAGGKAAKVQGRIAQAFATGDANSDGLLDRQEFRTALHALFPPKPKTNNAAKPANRTANGKKHVSAFDRADTNHDGKVSKAEFTTFVTNRLAAHRKGSGAAAKGKGVAAGAQKKKKKNPAPTL